MTDDDKYYRLQVLIGSSEFLDAQTRVQAEALVESIGSDTLKSSALSKLATAAAKTSDWVLSERAANAIGNPHRRALALIAVASEALAIGDIAKAQALFLRAENSAHTVDDPEEKSWGLYLLSSSLTGAGSVADAQRVAEHIDDAYDQGSAFNKIAARLIADGHIDQALNILQRVEERIERAELSRPWEKAEVLCRTARSFFELKDPSHALELLELATTIAVSGQQSEDFQESSDSSSVLREIGFTRRRLWKLEES